MLRWSAFLDRFSIPFHEHVIGSMRERIKGQLGALHSFLQYHSALCIALDALDRQEFPNQKSSALEVALKIRNPEASDMGRLAV